jgi:hypothetical protein
MPVDKEVPDEMHFRSLRLENVRAFGSVQNLEFIDESGIISRWNLILGGQRCRQDNAFARTRAHAARFRLSPDQIEG